MIVELTDEQKTQVAPLLEKAMEDYKLGLPGIVIAQVRVDNMIVGFLPHEKAKLFEKESKSI